MKKTVVLSVLFIVGMISVMNAQCPYTSVQARVQKNEADPWKQAMSVNVGQSFRVGAFKNGWGQFVDCCTTISVAQPNGGVIYPANGTYVTATLPGTYTLRVVCEGLSDTATVTTSNSLVTVFEHCNYGGYGVALPAGDYRLSDLTSRGVKNDDLSSIKVPGGFSAILYEHDNFQGASWPVSSDVDCFVASGWNDRVSSIKVIKTDFVSVVNGHFNINGNEFRHVGVNTPGLIYETSDERKKDLDMLKNAGVKQVRVLLANNMFTNQEIGDRLQTVLTEAYSQRGIRLTIVFTSSYKKDVWAHEGRGGFHFPAGDENNFQQTQSGHWLYKNAWFNGDYTRFYKPFVEYIVNRFKDHTGIFAWELGNELIDAEYEKFGNGAFLLFNTDMAAFIRQKDPNHLIATGIINTSHMALTPQQKTTLYGNANIHYVTNHTYNHVNEFTDWDIAQQTGKPYVIEETGFDVNQYANPAQETASFFQRAYSGNECRADAVMVWGVQSGQHGSGDALYGPFEQNRLNEYIALWQQWRGILHKGPCEPGPTGWFWWHSGNFYHQIGRQDGYDWSANVAQDSPGYLIYGPYDRRFGSGPHTAYFLLMIDNNSANNDVVITLDVVMRQGQNVLARRDVRRKDFGSANAWQWIPLNFNDPCFGDLEARVYWHDKAYIKFGQLYIFR